MTSINKIPIGGIKFSEERVHHTISLPVASVGVVNDILQSIYNKQVNIPFLCQATQKESTRLSFCVSKGDDKTISDIISFPLNSALKVKTVGSVASVTVFPHKKQLSFTAVVMSLLESHSLPVYSCCSSISALVFNTDFHKLENISAALTSIFELPDNHSPFQPQFQLRQPRNGHESKEI